MRATAVVIDRSWISKLVFEREKIPREISAIFAESRLVVIESGGASALEVQLAGIDYLKKKLYRIKPRDMPTLSVETKSSLRAKLALLSQGQEVKEALRYYRAAAGRMSDPDEALLGYVFRLLILSANLKAEILVWDTRYRIIRATLKESGITFVEKGDATIMHLVSERTLFPLSAKDGVGARKICVRTVLSGDALSVTVETRTPVRSGGPGHMVNRDVFICHASEDRIRVVLPLVDTLGRGGITTWLDEAEIGWGDSLTAKVNQGLRVSQFIVVVLSSAFLGKNWPERELNSALNIEASTGEVKVLPILVGTEAERTSVLKRYPLLSDKLYLVWDGSGENALEALRRRLG